MASDCLTAQAPAALSLPRESATQEVLETRREWLWHMRSTHDGGTVLTTGRLERRSMYVRKQRNNNVQSQQPNPIDVVPDKIPFDVPYGPPISLERAQAAINAVVAEANKRGWKMNVAVRRQPRRLPTHGWRDACLHSDRRAQGTGSSDVPSRNQGL